MSASLGIVVDYPNLLICTPNTAKRRPLWGILEVIDLESYRNEAREAVAVKHADEDAEVLLVPTGSIGTIVSPEMDPPQPFSTISAACPVT